MESVASQYLEAVEKGCFKTMFELEQKHEISFQTVPGLSETLCKVITAPYYKNGYVTATRVLESCLDPDLEKILPAVNGQIERLATSIRFKPPITLENFRFAEQELQKLCHLVFALNADKDDIPDHKILFREACRCSLQALAHQFRNHFELSKKDVMDSFLELSVGNDSLSAKNNVLRMQWMFSQFEIDPNTVGSGIYAKVLCLREERMPERSCLRRIDLNNLMVPICKTMCKDKRFRLFAAEIPVMREDVPQGLVKMGACEQVIEWARLKRPDLL